MADYYKDAPIWSHTHQCPICDWKTVEKSISWSGSHTETNDSPQIQRHLVFDHILSLEKRVKKLENRNV